MHLLRGPNEDQMDIICEELNEDSDRFEHNVRLLHNWMTYQAHLPKNFDEKIIPVFLRGCKHDIERAKRKLELYYSVRRSVPELYQKRDPTSYEARMAARIMNIIPLSNLTKDGYRVTVHKLGSTDIEFPDVKYVMQYFTMMGDIRVHSETAIAGDIYIMDADNNLTAALCAKTASLIVRKTMMVAHEVYPQRMKNIHVLNAPIFADKILTIIKSFMKEKLRNRFIVHRSIESLLDYIPAEILPTEYGGKAGDLSTMHENWQLHLQEKRDWFAEQESIVAVGPIPRHLSHSCALDSVEGIQGSFRTLTID